MKKLTLCFAVMLAAAGVFAACSSGGPGQPPGQEARTGSVNYTNISPQELNSMLANKDFPLINVHIPYEGEIANTDMFIPYNRIQAGLEQLPQDKTAKIVLYCRSGSMSAAAAEALAEAGYTNVFNLEGGMYAWQDAGYQLLQKTP